MVTMVMPLQTVTVAKISMSVRCLIKLTNLTFAMKMLTVSIQRPLISVTVMKGSLAMVKIRVRISMNALWGSILVTLWRNAKITKVAMSAPVLLSKNGVETVASVLRFINLNKEILFMWLINL